MFYKFDNQECKEVIMVKLLASSTSKNDERGWHLRLYHPHPGKKCGSRNARLIADELGVTVVPINPLSYEWR